MAAPKRRAESLEIKPRDLDLLRGLFESRVMTTKHAMTLYFDGKGEAAKKRLQKLKAAGFVSERLRRPFEPSVLFLTRKGLEILQQHGVLANYPPFDLPALERRARVSDLTIRHELEVMDVKTAFHSAVTKLPAVNIAEFSTWPLLHEFTVYHPSHSGAEVVVKPDGFIRFHERNATGEKYERTFFLELDRSTEIQDKLISKVVAYFEYYKSGGFAVRNGATRDNYKEFPFRILIICKSVERLNNTAERLLQNTPPILTMAWLATTPDVITTPFDPIWIRPSEYRDVTKGTSFDAERTGRSFVYRRNAEREAFIKSKIQKHSILET
jgi:hypothetical protein